MCVFGVGWLGSLLRFGFRLRWGFLG